MKATEGLGLLNTNSPFSLLVSVACSVMFHSLRPHGLSPGQNTGAGSLSLLQGIFPTQGSNPGLPHCRWILYQLSHQGTALFRALTLTLRSQPDSSSLSNVQTIWFTSTESSLLYSFLKNTKYFYIKDFKSSHSHLTEFFFF